ncbi:MAG TPA: hypothetical protein VGW38_27515, partial [Chloroflexota bacterium]|nr:hypothetical protein [Chloroflexota bacterium]
MGMKIGARLVERWKRWSVALAFGLIVAPLGVTAAGAQATAPYEVWVVDQANADVGGNKLYIFQGSQLSGNAAVGAPAVVDLQSAATGVGDGPGVRPHLLLFNARHTHGVLANVASGHVHFIRASDRR